MKTTCTCGCGNSLTGKQKKFWSDACRKRHNRGQTEREKVRELTEIIGPGQKNSDFKQFSVRELSENGRYRVLDVLISAIEYEETWIRRFLAQKPAPADGQLATFQESAAYLRVLVDGLADQGEGNK